MRASREYLSGQYLPKIRACLERLPETDLWWRPNPASNSVGNLVLHLAGNVRQWVVAGIAGGDDVRDRPAEFAATTGFGSLYHPVEHFSMHTGQILWITKMRTGEGLGFYSVADDGTVRTHW